MVRVINKKYLSSSLEETFSIGKEISTFLKKNQIVAFKGDLGAGKTSLIKGIVSSLCKVNKDEVISPTFIYLNIYKSGIPIYHFDLYRIKNENHFLSMGFDEYLSNENICLIEWSEHIPSLLPKNTLTIKIKQINKTQRSIDLY